MLNMALLHFAHGILDVDHCLDNMAIIINMVRDQTVVS